MRIHGNGIHLDVLVVCLLVPIQTTAWTVLDAAVEHRDRGDEAFAAEDLGAALENYTLALENAPNDALSLYKRGIVLLRRGKYQAALADLRDAVSIEPEFLEGQVQLARLELSLGACEEAAERLKCVVDLGNAMDPSMQKLMEERDLALECDVVKEKIRSALQHKGESDLFDAFNLLNWLLEIAPLSPRARSLRADLGMRLREYELASSDARYMILLNPFNMKAWMLRGRAYYFLGEYEGAERNYRRALRLDPDGGGGHVQRELRKVRAVGQLVHDGMMYMDKGRIGAAIKVFTQALVIDPAIRNQTTTLPILLARCYLQVAMVQEAIDILSQVLEAHPKCLLALLLRGGAHFRLAQYEEAVNDYSRATILDPNDPTIPERIEAAKKGNLRRKCQEYYDLLNVTRNCTAQDVKRAYHKMALLWHPDKHPEEADFAEQRFHKIAEAYKVLSNNDTRAACDRDDPIDFWTVMFAQQQRQAEAEAKKQREEEEEEDHSQEDEEMNPEETEGTERRNASRRSYESTKDDLRARPSLYTSSQLSSIHVIAHNNCSGLLLTKPQPRHPSSALTKTFQIMLRMKDVHTNQTREYVQLKGEGTCPGFIHVFCDEIVRDGWLFPLDGVLGVTAHETRTGFQAVKLDIPHFNVHRVLERAADKVMLEWHLSGAAYLFFHLERRPNAPYVLKSVDIAT